jgi:hypothetical protein
MNFELTRKLMQDGFVFQKPSLADVQSGQVKPRLFWVESTAYLLPTLSELIDACGKPLSLESYTEEWIACQGQGMACPTGRGATPEEAVANLWLTLHISTSPANHS